MKIMDKRLWHPSNTNLDLLFLVQIEAPRQGAEKCPETPKITNFTGKSPNFGKIPLKLVKSAFLHRNFDPGTGTLISGLKTFRGVAKYEGYFLWNFMNFHENL